MPTYNYARTVSCWLLTQACNWTSLLLPSVVVCLYLVLQIIKAKVNTEEPSTLLFQEGRLLKESLYYWQPRAQELLYNQMFRGCLILSK